MKFILEIDIKNDALTGGGTYQRNEEVARILTVAASKIEDGHGTGYLLDINGNTVGTFAFLGDS